MYTPQATFYTAILTGMMVLLSLIIFFIISIIRYQRRKVAFHRKKTGAEIVFLDLERQRIAADMHDDIGATLSSVKLKLQYLSHNKAMDGQVIESAEESIDQIMQKIRTISFNLMPQVLQRKGLTAALKELIDVMTFETNITVNYNYALLSEDRKDVLHIYRICQEIMNNIIKHSNAAKVEFNITKQMNVIEIHIKDDGIGFNKNYVAKVNKGLGLHNIVSRVELLRGAIYLTTETGKGTDYLIEIPANDQ